MRGAGSCAWGLGAGELTPGFYNFSTIVSAYDGAGETRQSVGSFVFIEVRSGLLPEVWVEAPPAAKQNANAELVLLGGYCLPIDNDDDVGDDDGTNTTGGLVLPRLPPSAPGALNDT